MMLGINWLKSYGRVTFDFQLNSVTISKEGQGLELKGIEEGATLKLITAAQWRQEVEKGECYLLSHQAVSKESSTEVEIHPKIQLLLG